MEIYSSSLMRGPEGRESRQYGFRSRKGGLERARGRGPVAFMFPCLAFLASLFLYACDPYSKITDGGNLPPPPQRGVASKPMDIPESFRQASIDGLKYVVGPGDVLEIKVVDYEDLNREVQISEQGDLLFPLIGRVLVAGRSTEEIQREIARRLGAGYLLDPKVTVTVKEYKSQKVFVVGGVQKPGSYPLKGPTTVLDMLMEAGGASDQADDHLLIIRPKDPDRRAIPSSLDDAKPGEFVKLDLKAIQTGGLSFPIFLKNGDTIVVPKAEPAYYYVLGEVVTPGQYEHKKGLTILQAITIAGGITQRGSIEKTKVIRDVDGEKKEIPADMGSYVQPNDIIKVKRRLF